MIDCSYRWQVFLVKASLLCAFLTLCTISFDMVPWMSLPYMPPKLSYPIAFLGLFLFLFSGCWLKVYKAYRAFLFLILAGLALSLISTLDGMSTIPLSQAQQREILIGYLRWQVFPLFFALWFAMLFSCFKQQYARRVFAIALVVLAVSNGIHIFLEFLANNGCTSIKAFLISINSSFRLECIGHGWWPPAYYHDRIRGLFAEPSYMAFGLLPLLGYFLFVSTQKQKRLWGILGIILFGAVMFFGKIRSGGMAFLCAGGVFFVFHIWQCYGQQWRRLLASVFLASLLLVFVAFPFGLRFLSQYYEQGLAEADAVCAYVDDIHSGRAATQPSFKGGIACDSNMARYTVACLDLQMAQKRLLGVGFYQRGFYWEPLFTCPLAGSGELQLFVDQAKNDSVHRVPPLNQYTVILAEYGFPGLVLFVLICLIPCLQALRNYWRSQDNYILAMLAAFVGMLFACNATPAINALIFHFFLGYVASLTPLEVRPDEQAQEESI